MKNIFFLLLLATFLNAQNPKIYSALGDVIYNNLDGISKLKNYILYAKDIEKINEYIKKVKLIKKKGFLIENGNKKINKYDYLNSLRSLSKINDFYLRSVKNNFKKSIENKDSKLFEQMVNSGLVDTKRYKSKIITYYLFHIEDINATGVIQNILDQNKELKKKKQVQKKVYKSKHKLQEEKMKRIRAKDKLRQAKIEREINLRVNNEKKEIIKNQTIDK